MMLRFLRVLADKLSDLQRDWDQFRSYFNSLKEPRRDFIRLSSLNLGNNGEDNIRKVYNLASESEKDYWGEWYKHASYEVHRLSESLDLPFPFVAAVTAVLSPGNRWFINLRAAAKFLTFWKAGLLKDLGPVEAYPVSLQKAIRIAERFSDTGEVDESYVSTPKVGVFYNSLVDPEGIEHDMVLDGHAINIFRGEKRSLKGLKLPDNNAYEDMRDAYKKVAFELGISTQALQATTWYVWKFVR